MRDHHGTVLRLLVLVWVRGLRAVGSRLHSDVNDMSLEELDEVLQSQPAAAQDDTTPSSGNRTLPCAVHPRLLPSLPLAVFSLSTMHVLARYACYVSSPLCAFDVGV